MLLAILEIAGALLGYLFMQLLKKFLLKWLATGVIVCVAAYTFKQEFDLHNMPPNQQQPAVAETAAKAKQQKPPKWGKSQAKKLLSLDIIAGKCNDKGPKEVYEM